MEEHIVKVREVWIQDFLVEADSEEEAIRRVQNGEGEIVDNVLEYSHTLEPETWTVDE